ncbi:unnamed protein product, partial [Mesorhabditis belari]|uniref:Glycoprotein-N-acetylgalactosamine 3-beta-galactosyltransferase 1 n=1 Tax=Mesorhabditis belari TaxID=2138241 RepID=A0AAF3E9P2_9BILA
MIALHWRSSSFFYSLIGFFLGASICLLLQGGQYRGLGQRMLIYHRRFIGKVLDLNNKTLAGEISKKVRILCWILTGRQFHWKRAIHVKTTWGRRCDKLIFMSSENNTMFPAIDLGVKEGRNHLWAKTKKALRYVYDNYINDYDWFLKADDDTYVIMENLKFMLLSKDPKVPINYGFEFSVKLKYKQNPVLSGGAGYVLSKAALFKFVTEALGKSSKCSTREKGSEDVELARCLKNVGVIRGDSRDEGGKQRFIPVSIDSAFIPQDKQGYWFIKRSKYPFSRNHISNLTIAIHYVNGGMMHALEHLLYQARIYGNEIPISSPEEATKLLEKAREDSEKSSGSEDPMKNLTALLDLPTLNDSKSPKTKLIS